MRDYCNNFFFKLQTDPDAPSRTDAKFREYRHWLVVNVQNNDIAGGDTLFEFIGTGAPKDTGLHRYVFLIFEQTGKIDTSSISKTRNCSGEGRPKTGTDTLIQEHQLGNPVFGNFYQAQYDDYVPKLYEQLAGCKD